MPAKRLRTMTRYLSGEEKRDDAVEETDDGRVGVTGGGRRSHSGGDGTGELGPRMASDDLPPSATEGKRSCP